MPSTALDYITIQGFKSIKSIENLRLNPVNILIGANGSGKSNFLAVFELIDAIRDKKLEEYVIKAGGAERVLHFGSKTTHQILVRMPVTGLGEYYELTLLPAAPDGLRFKERIPIITPPAATYQLCHFHDTSLSSPMRKTAQLDDNRGLRSNGSNLAAFLYFLCKKHAASYRLIERATQLVAPFFGGFQLEPRSLQPDTILLEWTHKNSDQYFDASSMSDGTLRFIALATLFLQPVELRPSVILVDEPELGLHPAAIELLASLIRQASTETQVVVSTQSSLLLDHFEPEDVLVADRVDGGTTLTRLDPKRLASWLEDYSLGQLWEKNEFGGRPAPG